MPCAKYDVLVDGNIVGAVKAGRGFAVPAEAGRNLVRLEIDWCRSQDVEVDVPEGGEVHLDCRPNAGAWRLYWDATVGASKYITFEPRS